MTPQHLTRLEMSRAASDLLDRGRSGEIVLSDRVRDLASFLFLPALDDEVKGMMRRVRDLRRDSLGATIPEIERITNAIDERIESAAMELADLLDAPDRETP